MELSTYQQNIINYVKNNNGNLLVNAKAGSGKTFTLVLIAKEILNQGNKCLFLAFNKHIVEELQSRIEDVNCEIKTVHSLGLSFIRSYLYRKHGKDYILEVESDSRPKARGIIRNYFEKICLSEVQFTNQDLGKEEYDELINDMLSDLLKMLDFVRFYNVNYNIPSAIISLAYKCMNTSTLCSYKSNGLTNYPEVIRLAMEETKKLFLEGEIDESTNKPLYRIDYTDMVYFPLFFRMPVPFSLKDKLDYILIDEAQDMSIMNQKFVASLHNFRNTTRYIFVGDEKQSIYGFAGADTNSIDNIKYNFNLKELPLNICYRCPENVIRLTKPIVDNIEWNIERPDRGIAEFINYDKLFDKIQPNDIILIRTNKDLTKLFKTCMLDKHINVKFRNEQLVETIAKEIDKVIKEYITRYNKYENIEKELYENFVIPNDIPVNKSLRTPEQQQYVDDKALELIQEAKTKPKKITKSNYSLDYLITCMEEFKEFGEYEYLDEDDSIYKGYYDLILAFKKRFEEVTNAYTLKTFQAYIRRFLSSNSENNVPMLSSIHQMKGGECDRIFIYDYPRFPYSFKGMTEDQQQQERNLQYVALTRAKKELYLVGIKPDEDSPEIEKLNSECEANIRIILSEAQNNIQDVIEDNTKFKMI